MNAPGQGGKREQAERKKGWAEGLGLKHNGLKCSQIDEREKDQQADKSELPKGPNSQKRGITQRGGQKVELKPGQWGNQKRPLSKRAKKNSTGGKGPANHRLNSGRVERACTEHPKGT